MIDRTTSAFDKLCTHAREVALLESLGSLLGWDERTYMPPGGAEYRAEQMRYLSGLIHSRRIDPRVGEWLDELADSPLAADGHSDSGATIREIRREYEKRKKIPQSLVEELARLAVLGEHAWIEARRDNDFPHLRPYLEQIVALKRQQAEAVGYEESPYDALLDDYEPGARTGHVRQVLADLGGRLPAIVDALRGAPRQPDVSILRRQYPVAAQEALGREVAAAIGFDFHRGRLDVTQHPFCAEIGPNDCRITTRYNETFVPTALFGILHEAGHAIYDQGLRGEQYGLPPGTFTSLGIHESQSRMWENMVGRSRQFWQHFYPRAQTAFPAALGDVPLDAFVLAVNDVRPSLIRVEADEVTYNLHIIIRFELEQALISGDLTVGDLPGAWREKYRHYLGIEPSTDAEGVLQDIHWSGAAIGYFPTYSLGNLYAAQFFDQAKADLGDLDGQFARGQFQPLREWLVSRIHGQGRCYTAPELVERITGRPLSPEPLVTYLRGKLFPLYGL